MNRPRDPVTGRMLPIDTAARFWPKVNKDGPTPAHRPDLGPCWVWIAATFPGRMTYGMFRFNLHGQHGQTAHRGSWALNVGPIPDGLNVLHHCDNPKCVRPEHLFLGTTLDNIRDRDAKGRQAAGDRQALRLDPKNRHYGDANGSRTKPESRPRGEGHWKARLTAVDVAEIRRRRQAGERIKDLARAFAVSGTHIKRVVLGTSWKHVETQGSAA